MDQTTVSIVIPLLNEEESLRELYDWIKKVMDAQGLSFEVLFVDDGSTDTSWNIITDLNKADSRVRAFRFARNYGKSAALNTAFAETKGEYVITMDADLQDSPDEIPELIAQIKAENLDLVSGWKKKRFDPITKTLPTKLYNWATRKMSGIYLHDFNCGLKAYRGVVVRNIEVYGEMHRYIPVIAKRAGYGRIGEKVVQHRARKYGTTKFGLERFINGFLDLLTITFISRFGKKPMHFFGSLGTLMFIFGVVLFTIIGGQKVYFLAIGEEAKNITEISSFFIALTSVILGTQLFLAGFVAELISRNAPNRNSYSVIEKI
ncbi:MAG: glycosyltransferase involved in cell wall biosynthesis [Flavobacteriales bacterium]|jgi:glycosyltransferase involved in cell wall biosynthesis